MSFLLLLLLLILFFLSYYLVNLAYFFPVIYLVYFVSEAYLPSFFNLICKNSTYYLFFEIDRKEGFTWWLFGCFIFFLSYECPFSLLFLLLLLKFISLYQGLNGDTLLGNDWFITAVCMLDMLVRFLLQAGLFLEKDFAESWTIY